jgi:hypothetical protein
MLGEHSSNILEFPDKLIHFHPMKWTLS